MNPPALPDTFSWSEEAWGLGLRCRPLAAIAPHVFTTRQLPLSSADDWRALAAAVGGRRLRMLTQVHGSASVVVRGSSSADDERPEADILVSNEPDAALAVRAADCVPLLMADPETGAVAAVHAGWRGTAAGAAAAAVETLAREFGSRPADLVAAVGPSIGPCCYEVRSDVVDAFAAAGHARHLVDRWIQARPPRRGETARSSLRLDVWTANRDQLILAGLDDSNIHLCGLCTASHLELFPSYRVEGQQAGRLAGAIRSTGASAGTGLGSRAKSR